MPDTFSTIAREASDVIAEEQFLENYGVLSPIDDEIRRLKDHVRSIEDAFTSRVASESYFQASARLNELRTRLHAETLTPDGAPSFDLAVETAASADLSEIFDLQEVVAGVQEYGLWSAAANEFPELQELMTYQLRVSRLETEVELIAKVVYRWLPLAYESGFEDFGPEFFGLIGQAGEYEESDYEGSADCTELSSAESCRLGAVELVSYLKVALRPALSKHGRKCLKNLSRSSDSLGSEMHRAIWPILETYLP